MSEIESVKEKIAKLMAMANDGRGNEFEMQAALRQAQKLMTLHNIDVAELAARTSTKPVYKWATVLVPADAKNPTITMPGWFSQIGLGVAKFTDCKAEIRRHAEFGQCIALLGDESDVQFGVWLLKYLRDDARAVSAKFVGTREEKHNVRLGYVARVIDRMAAMKAEAAEELRAAITSAGTALAIVQNKVALRDAEFGGQKERTTRSNSYRADARAYGQQAGDRANLNRPIGQSRSALGN